MSSATKLQRWLDLVAYLASRRFPATTEEIWKAVPAYAVGLDEDGRTRREAVRRMFERDKDEPRAMGIPIETRTFPGAGGEEGSTGYRLARGDFHLPYLRLLRRARGEGGHSGDEAPPPGAAGSFHLRPEEAAAALEGLAELALLPGYPLAAEARSAHRKLAFDLEPETGRAREGGPLLYAVDPETAASAPAVARIAEALRKRKLLRFTYHSMSRDERSGRTVEPWGLLFQHGRWYLIGRDRRAEDVRMFRVGRMEELEAEARRPGTPDYEVPDDFRVADYGGRRAWELGGGDEPPEEAVVRFHPPRSIWAERNRLGEPVGDLSDGGQLRRFAVRRRDPFLRWVLSLAGDAVIVRPPHLARAFRELAGAVARRYAGTGEGRSDA